MADTPATATPTPTTPTTATTTTPTTATTTPKRIKVSFRFTRDTDNVVLNRGNAVDKDLDGNVHFPNLPGSLADLRANKATYSDLITASLDGSKKAIAARKKQRHIIIGQLRDCRKYKRSAGRSLTCYVNPRAGVPAAQHGVHTKTGYIRISP